MFGQEVENSEIEAKQAKIQAIQNVAEFRDKLFDESQGKMIKIIGGGVIGIYLIYKFLLK